MPGLCCRALTTNTCRLTIKASFSNARRAYTCGGPLRDRTFPRTIFSVKQCAYMKRPKGSGRTGMMKPCCGGIHARERSWPAALRNALSTISVPLCLRVQREALLLRLTANFFADHQLVRVDRSDRTLGEMRCGLDCFRLGNGGRV